MVFVQIAAQIFIKSSSRFVQSLAIMDALKANGLENSPANNAIVQNYLDNMHNTL